ncbi:MAG: PEP-CTERM sorting domain-containing protein [Planctomycetaceae bacterium]
MTIIGWSDQQFVPASAAGGVSGTGARLVQNSWGTGYWCNQVTGSNDGTFWGSYDDAAIGRSGVASFTMRAALPVLQNEVGPLSVPFQTYSADTLPTGMASLTSGSVPASGLVASGTVASVLVADHDCTLSAIGVASQMAGATVTVNLYSQSAGGALGGTLLASIANAPLQVGYAELPLSAGIFLPANGQLVVELAYSDPAAVPVVIGPDVINLAATGSESVRSGLGYSLATSGTWVDLATMRFKNDAIAGQSADGGILFAKGVVAVPEPTAMGGAFLAISGIAWRKRRRLTGSGRVIAA